MRSKKNSSKKKKPSARQKGEVDSLTKKYEGQLAQFGLTEFAEAQTNKLFKKCSILNDDFIFISSATLKSSTGI